MKSRFETYTRILSILALAATVSALDAHAGLSHKETPQQAQRRLKNKEEGEAFLAQNKAKDGVVTLASGLQYKILKAGDGKKPTLDDTVVAHYRGTFIDGTEFDSSYARNQPGTFAMKKLIKGWSEALQLMSVGSKWQLFVPSDLAYGQRGAGPRFPPNSTLVFDVELIAIKDASGVEAKKEQPNKAAAARAGIEVSYKLDPRLTRSLYMGDRWVSPPTFTSVLQEGKDVIVVARAYALDAYGSQTSIAPKWIAADPEMVVVTPSEGSEVKIIVKRAGQTNLTVAYGDAAKQLTVKAGHQNGILQVDISQ